MVEVSFSADQAAARFAHKVHLVKGIRNYFNLYHKIFVGRRRVWLFAYAAWLPPFVPQDVLMFWRMQDMLRVSAKTLRQQVMYHKSM